MLSGAKGRGLACQCAPVLLLCGVGRSAGVSTLEIEQTEALAGHMTSPLHPSTAQRCFKGSEEGITGDPLGYPPQPPARATPRHPTPHTQRREREREREREKKNRIINSGKSSAVCVCVCVKREKQR